MCKRQGFTLVELLVVIAIIALLMAILMPALNRVKKQAKSVACKVTLHQWSLIWGLYCEDNDNKFCEAGGLGWKRGTWIIALRSQWETRTDILRCRMAVKRRLDGKEWGGPLNTYVMGSGGFLDLREECSFGANNWIYDFPAGLANIQNRPTEWNWRTPDVSGGNNIPVFADTMWRGGGPFTGGKFLPDDIPDRGSPPVYDGEWSGASSEMKHFCINRHNERINMLFMDWSSREVGLKELWTLKWHRFFSTSGPWTMAGLVEPRDWPEWMRNFKDY